MTDYGFGWEFVDKQRLAVALFAVSMAGKTRLSTIMPEEFGYGVLVNYDVGGRSLASISAEERKRIALIVRPNGRPEYKMKGKERELNSEGEPIVLATHWREELFDLAKRNWPTWMESQLTSGAMVRGKHVPEDFKPEQLGWKTFDTMSQASTELLRESSIQQWFTDKNPTAGPKTPTLEVDAKWVMPAMGDYRMVQQLCVEAIEHWLSDLSVADSLHAIVNFQEGHTQDTESGVVANSVMFGPFIEGRKGPRIAPPRFDATLWLTRDIDKVSQTMKGVNVHIQPTESRVCGFKSPKPQDVPLDKIIGPNPDETREFWRWVLGMKS
jgi:hypothetical protein